MFNHVLHIDALFVSFQSFLSVEIVIKFKFNHLCACFILRFNFFNQIVIFSHLFHLFCVDVAHVLKDGILDIRGLTEALKAIFRRL